MSDIKSDHFIDIEGIAIIIHETLRLYAEVIKADPLPPWDEAPDYMKVSTRDSVRFRLANPDKGAREQHDSWMEEKLADGWRYGPVKDTDAKTHPMIIPFDEMPASEQAKDRIIVYLVDALKP